MMAATPELLLDHADHGVSWPDDLAPPVDATEAYALSAAVRALRERRGERVVGYKIGFTNRTIWSRYAVFGPIWGPVYDTTFVQAVDDRGTLDLDATAEPRIEPECVFGIARTPAPDVTLDALFDCIDWFAPGFEIVQSHARGWRFTAPQTMADGGLHARLLVGTRRPVRDVASSGTAFDALLARTRVVLSEDGVVRDEGVGANVLDGPLHALLHFVHERARIPDAPALAAGDVVTTGTWTDAQPVVPGTTWRAAFDAPLRPLDVVLR